MLQSLNQTNVALIPKVKYPQSVHHYRLISLCIALYKVISKVSANRIKSVLSFVGQLVLSFVIEVHLFSIGLS